MQLKVEEMVCDCRNLLLKLMDLSKEGRQELSSQCLARSGFVINEHHMLTMDEQWKKQVKKVRNARSCN